MEEAIAVFSPAEPSLINDIYIGGIAMIHAIQTIENPPLTAVMKWLTQLGSEWFYIITLLFIFWCIDEKQGFRFSILILFSLWLNGFCKLLFKQPRPFHLDPPVSLSPEITEPLRGSYGFPSGHAQLSLVFWSTLAFNLRGRFHKRSGAAAAGMGALFFILVIAFTRLYLGVHFPTDILGGWFLGALMLLLYSLFSARIAALLRSGGLRPQIVAAAAAGLLINASGLGENMGGLFMGYCAGYALLCARIGFSARGNLRGARPGAAILFIRFVMGIAGVGILYFLLRAILPGADSLFRESALWGAASPALRLARFIRYGALGLFATAGAPWLFIRLGLAARRTDPEQGPVEQAGEHPEERGEKCPEERDGERPEEQGAKRDMERGVEQDAGRGETL
jgi:membrane-associated phospholipid phosphatase